MDSERDDATQGQFDNDEVQGEASEGGYPEEQPGGGVDDDKPGDPLDRSGNPRQDSGDSPGGASGEGTQSTGNPDAAG